MHDNSIRQRLLLANDNLLFAISQDPSALRNFEEEWAKLQQDIDSAMLGHELDPDTMSLIHEIASRVAILADCALDLHHKYDAISSSLQDELEDILGRCSLEGISAAHSPPSYTIPSLSHRYPCSTSIMQSASPLPCPPFVPSAYNWLLKNLHNPYPSNDVKTTIAGSTGASIDRIGAWFTSARKRMGWTAISQKFYANSRADTVDGAYRAFIQDDSRRPLEADIAYEFMLMKVNAEGLYSAKLRKSVLAGNLDMIVKDVTDEDLATLTSTKAEGLQDKQKGREIETAEKKRLRTKRKQVQEAVSSGQEKASSSYPSPERSTPNTPERRPDSSLESGTEDVECNLSLPSLIVGRKRHASPSSDQSTAGSFSSVSWSQPNKRQRTDRGFPSVDVGNSDPCASLPSPLSRSSSPLDEPITSPPHITSSDPSTLPNRKRRRLSDSGAEGPKRPRCLIAGPRLQTVSDPLPMPKPAPETPELDAWCNFDFGLPPAVTSEEPDPSDPYDVEVFDWHTLDEISQILTPMSATAFSSCDKPQPVGLADFGLQSDNSSTDLSSLSLPGSESLDFLTFTQTLPTSSAEDIISQTYASGNQQYSSPYRSSETVDHNEWTDLPLYFELSSEPTDSPLDVPSLSHTGSIFGHSTLPELGPPPLLPGVMLPPTLELEKQVKLEKLRAHREAVRKLEEELLSSA